MKNRIRLAIIFGVEFIAVAVLLVLIFFAGKKSYTVTFDLNGGTLLSGDLVQEVRQGGNATPPVTVKDGCYFHSWSTSYTKVTKDITVRAIWEYETTVGITYTTDGDGSESNYCEISGSFEGLRGDVYIGAYHGNKKVLGIQDGAFKGRSGIEHIYMLDGIVMIGESAFEDCTSLETIILPNTIAVIEAGAFRNCTSLKRVVLPATLASLGEEVFAGCTSLEEVVFLTEQRVVEADPEQVVEDADEDEKDRGDKDNKGEPADPIEYYDYSPLTEIAEGSFSGCGALVSVNIPPQVTVIGEAAFKGCSSLESIGIPDGVVGIGNSAFEGCELIEELILPEGLLIIGERAFAGCDAIAEVTVPESVTAIGLEAFDNPETVINVLIFETMRPEGWVDGCFASEPVWLIEPDIDIELPTPEVNGNLPLAGDRAEGPVGGGVSNKSVRGAA